MGSTTVTFDGRSFEASDGQLEIWLELLVSEIDRRAASPLWLRQVRDDWHLQATAGFGMGVIPDLDRHVTDEERRATLIALCEAGLARLEALGDTLSRDQLNALGTGGEGSAFTTDLPTELFRRVGLYFLHLLQRQLSPDEIDARF